MCLACEVYGGIHGLAHGARRDDHPPRNDDVKADSAKTVREAEPLPPQGDLGGKKGA